MNIQGEESTVKVGQLFHCRSIAYMGRGEPEQRNQRLSHPHGVTDRQVDSPGKPRQPLASPEAICDCTQYIAQAVGAGLE